MSDARKVADRYIEPGGYMPGERAERWSHDLLSVASFIGWHDDNHMRGGLTAGEAFAALCRLLNLEQHVMRKIIGRDAN